MRFIVSVWLLFGIGWLLGQAWGPLAYIWWALGCIWVFGIVSKGVGTSE